MLPRKIEEYSDATDEFSRDDKVKLDSSLQLVEAQ